MWQTYLSLMKSLALYWKEQGAREQQRAAAQQQTERRLQLASRAISGVHVGAGGAAAPAGDPPGAGGSQPLEGSAHSARSGQQLHWEQLHRISARLARISFGEIPSPEQSEAALLPVVVGGPGEVPSASTVAANGAAAGVAAGAALQRVGSAHSAMEAGGAGGKAASSPAKPRQGWARELSRHLAREVLRRPRFDPATLRRLAAAFCIWATFVTFQVGAALCCAALWRPARRTAGPMLPQGRSVLCDAQGRLPAGAAMCRVSSLTRPALQSPAPPHPAPLARSAP